MLLRSIANESKIPVLCRVEKGCGPQFMSLSVTLLSLLISRSLLSDKRDECRVARVGNARRIICHVTEVDGEYQQEELDDHVEEKKRAL